MTDNMPDFDSMTEQEIMEWMETLAKRNGAVEGLMTDANAVIQDADPNAVVDGPGYIPYGMDPEEWERRLAEEERVKAERRTTAAQHAPPPAASKPEPEPAVEASPLDFLAGLAGGDTEELFEAVTPEVTPTAAAEPVAELDDSLDFLSELSDLGQASEDFPDLEGLDFGGLESLGFEDEPAAAQGAENSRAWLDHLVGESATAEDTEDEDDVAPALDLSFLSGLERPSDQDSLPESDEAFAAMLLDDDVLEDSAVNRVLTDSMDWLSDFADDVPVETASASQQVLQISDDLDSFFERVQREAEEESNTDISLEELGLTAETQDVVASALSHGEEVSADQVKAWMDSLLDQGMARTDVVEDDDETSAEPAELPDWLVSGLEDSPVSEVGELDETDLPDWLTAPISDDQASDFDELFQVSESASLPQEILNTIQGDTSPIQPTLNTETIRVEMTDDPWVEAFEMERRAKTGDTDALEAWYEAAQADMRAGENPTGVIPLVADESLEVVNFKPDPDLQLGQQMPVPDWLGGDEQVTADDGAPNWLETDSLEPVNEADLPEWLRQAQLGGTDTNDVPDWLNKTLSIGAEAGSAVFSGDDFGAANIPEDYESYQNDEYAPIEVRRTTAIPRYEAPRPTVQIAVLMSEAEAGATLTAARESYKHGEVAKSLATYEHLVQAEARLEDVALDLDRMAKDPANKNNPGMLRVYGDALLRQGKLQAALDTYRAALNLL